MKRNIKIISVVIFLTLLDQGIKIMINQYFFDRNFNILWEYVQFKPHLNIEYSWINSLFHLGIGRFVHILLVILIMIAAVVVYKFINTMYDRKSVIDYFFILIISASSCSLIDKVFWGGSLDYILFRGLFIFDLKDVYATAFEITVVIMFIFNYKNLRNISDKKLLSDLKHFITKRNNTNR